MRVEITTPARTDLREIGDWIALDNPARARSFVRNLVGRCQRLAPHPARHPIIIRLDGRELRRCVHRNYLIFFEIERESNVINVVRIIHGAPDYQALFEPNSPYEAIQGGADE